MSVLKNKTLYLIFGVTLFAVMGVASITPAFPVIIEHFKLTVPQVGLLITVFTVPGVVLAHSWGCLPIGWGAKQF
jgi:MFS family permease